MRRRTSIGRRRFLGAGLGLTAGALASWGPPAVARSGRWSALSQDADLEALADALAAASRDEAWALAVQALSAGADRTTLFGAVLVAGVRSIAPRRVGSEFHTVLMVASALRVTDGAPARDVALSVLWTVDDFVDAREAARARGTGPLPDEPEALAHMDDGVIELARALEPCDPERADRAVVTLCDRGRGLDALDVMRPYAARSFRDAGHRILFAAQAERVLLRPGCLGDRQARPVLRSLARALAAEVDELDAATTAFAREHAVASAVRAARSAEVPEESLAVLRALRGLGPEASQQAVVDALAEGLGPQTVWDGLRLAAAELVLARPDRDRAFPIHPVTELESLGWVASRARDAATARLVLLQAAAWLPRIRDAVIANNGPFGDDDIESLGRDVEPESLAAAVESRSAARVCAALEREGESEPALDAYAALLRTGLVRAAHQNHQYKLAAALLEEGARAHPRWRSRILASGVDYVPPPDAPTSPIHDRALRALG